VSHPLFIFSSVLLPLCFTSSSSVLLFLFPLCSRSLAPVVRHAMGIVEEAAEEELMDAAAEADLTGHVQLPAHGW